MMPSIKDVMDYGRMNFDEVMALPFDLFMLMRKHAFIDRMNQSEEGRQYLRDCKRLGQKSPEFEKLNRF